MGVSSVTQQRCRQWLALKGAASNNSDTAAIALIRGLSQYHNALSGNVQARFDNWLRLSIADLQDGNDGYGIGTDMAPLLAAYTLSVGRPWSIASVAAKDFDAWLRDSTAKLGTLTETIIYRVSCGDGGPPAPNDGGINWEADNPASSYVSGNTDTFSNGLAWSFDGSTPANMQIAGLTQEDRNAVSGNMVWTFDVSGYVQAKADVMVGEVFFTSAGNRIFSADANGTALFTDLDLYAFFGARGVAGVFSATVAPDVSDNLVITFTPDTNRPLVLAIQVSGLSL